MKLGKEIARFERRIRTGGEAHQLERVYSISLRECGTTLYRAHSPNTPKITNAWRRVLPWKDLQAVRADYIRRGYQEIT